MAMITRDKTILVFIFVSFVTTTTTASTSIGTACLINLQLVASPIAVKTGPLAGRWNVMGVTGIYRKVSFRLSKRGNNLSLFMFHEQKVFCINA